MPGQYRSASVTASEIGVHGGLSGAAASHGTIVTGAAAASDPLATLAAPPQPAAQFTAVTYAGTLRREPMSEALPFPAAAP